VDINFSINTSGHTGLYSAFFTLIPEVLAEAWKQQRASTRVTYTLMSVGEKTLLLSVQSNYYSVAH